MVLLLGVVGLTVGAGITPSPCSIPLHDVAQPIKGRQVVVSSLAALLLAFFHMGNLGDIQREGKGGWG